VADKNYMLVRFGRKIRFEREKRNISQEKLGELAGIHRTYVGMIERGEKNITLLNMEKVAQALDITLKQLVDF
jgi:transcriptional regulator with XRE-family HTH domain